MAKSYRTMRGRDINMDELILKQEKTIAVGNMNVNAAGDLIGPGGKIIQTKSERVRANAELHTMTPDNIPVQRTSTDKPKQSTTEVPIENLDPIVSTDSDQVDKEVVEPEASLAAAVAKKKSVEHKKTETKPSKKKKGVKRI